VRILVEGKCLWTWSICTCSYRQNQICGKIFGSDLFLAISTFSNTGVNLNIH
jgi:hypothetical protein